MSSINNRTEVAYLEDFEIATPNSLALIAHKEGRIVGIIASLIGGVIPMRSSVSNASLSDIVSTAITEGVSVIVMGPARAWRLGVTEFIALFDNAVKAQQNQAPAAAASRDWHSEQESAPREFFTFGKGDGNGSSPALDPTMSFDSSRAAQNGSNILILELLEYIEYIQEVLPRLNKLIYTITHDLNRRTGIDGEIVIVISPVGVGFNRWCAKLAHCGVAKSANVVSLAGEGNYLIVPDWENPTGMPLVYSVQKFQPLLMDFTKDGLSLEGGLAYKDVVVFHEVLNKCMTAEETRFHTDGGLPESIRMALLMQ